MGLSLRLLLLDQTDCIYRMDIARFDRIRESPRKHLLPRFAGQRVRSAEVVVSLSEGRPVRVVRTTFDMLTFDQTGCLDTNILSRQHFARFATAQSGLGTHAEGQPNVWDARHVFDDRGGRWVPSTEQLKAIGDAALGKKRVSRL